MRVRVTTTLANWLTGKACPKIPTGELDEEGEELRYKAVQFGNPGREFPATDSMPASGRAYTHYNLNEAQLTYISGQTGVKITRAGTFDGEEWPFSEE